MSRTDDPSRVPPAAQRWVLLVCLSLTLLVVLFGLQTNSRSSILIKEAAYVLGALAVCLSVAVLGLAGKLQVAPRLGPIQLLLLAAILVMGPAHMLAGSASVNTPYNSASLLALAVISLALALLGDRWLRDRLVLVFLAAGGLVCFYALLQWQGVELFSWDRALARSGRVSGSLGNPNLMGSLAAVLPMVALGYMIYRKLPAIVLIPASAAAVVASGLAIVASGTRGSLIGLGAGLLALTVLQARRAGRRVALLLVLLLILGLLVVYLPMEARFGELAGGEGGTLTVRRVIWSGAFRAFLERPIFGWGPGSLQEVLPAYRDPAYHLMGVSHNTLHAHCEYLEMLLDTGLVGALLWAGLLVALVVRRRRIARMDVMTVGILAAIFALGSEALVSVALRWAPAAMVLALLAGLAMIGGSESSPRWRDVPRPAALAALVPGALLLLSLPMYTGAMSAGRFLFKAKNIHLSRAEPAMSHASDMASRWAVTGDPAAASRAMDRWNEARVSADSAIYYCERCIEANPEDLGGWYALGSSYLTRAIVANPNSAPMSTLLERPGGMEIDSSLELDMTMQALEAYRRLRTLAPDYAEVHNNMALVHTRLDNLDSAMVYMYNAYMLHAHRRTDYYLQVSDLGPILDSDWAWRIYLHQCIPYVGILGEGRLAKFTFQRIGLLAMVSFLVQRYPERADSLARMADEVCARREVDIFGEDRLETLLRMAHWERLAMRADSLLLAGDTAAAVGLLDTIPAEEVTQGMTVPVVMGRAGKGDPVSAISDYVSVMVPVFDVHLGRTWLGLSPFADLVSFSIGEAGRPGWWQPLRSGTVLMLYADRQLSRFCELARGDFPRSTRDSVAALLEQRWFELGGPEYCVERADGRTPWLADGMLALVPAALDSLCAASDSGGPAAEEAHTARIEMAYAILSTQMWTSPYMTQDQVNSVVSWAAPSVRWLEDSLGGERYSDRISRRFRLVDGELEKLVPVANRAGMEALREWFSNAETAREGPPEIRP